MITTPFQTDQFDNTVMADGSFIHRSKRLDRASGEIVNLTRWFLWICTKPGTPGKGAQGYIVMDAGGVVYFDSWEAAMDRYRQIKTFSQKAAF